MFRFLTLIALLFASPASALWDMRLPNEQHPSFNIVGLGFLHGGNPPVSIVEGEIFWPPAPMIMITCAPDTAPRIDIMAATSHKNLPAMMIYYDVHGNKITDNTAMLIDEGGMSIVRSYNPSTLGDFLRVLKYSPDALSVGISIPMANFNRGGMYGDNHQFPNGAPVSSDRPRGHDMDDIADRFIEYCGQP